MIHKYFSLNRIVIFIVQLKPVFLTRFFFKLCGYVHISVWMCEHESSSHRSQERALDSPEAEVIGNCELTSVAAGN